MTGPNKIPNLSMPAVKPVQVNKPRLNLVDEATTESSGEYKKLFLNPKNPNASPLETLISNLFKSLRAKFTGNKKVS